MKRQRSTNPWLVRRASGPSLAFLFLLSVVAGNFFVVNAQQQVEFSLAPLVRRLVPLQPQFRRAFDGQSSDEQQLSRFAVIIDNMHDGRPPVGVGSAGLVIEAPVEAGITRWLAFFEFAPDSNKTPTPSVGRSSDPRPVVGASEKIGPVRSLRPYFFEWGKGYDTPIAHVGGSPEALKLATRSTLPTANEFAWGRFFLRDPARQDPHRIFTSVPLLSGLLDALRYSERSLTMPWTWADKPIATQSAAGAGLYRFPHYPTPPEEGELSWRYNPTARVFERLQGGKLQYDDRGATISAKHVFIIETNVIVTDAIGRRRITTTGRGTAWQLTDHGKQRIIWQRTLVEPYRFSTPDGTALTLEPGNIWFTVVPVGQEIVEARE